jgi:hypothetical protein
MSGFDINNFECFDPSRSGRVVDSISITRTNTIQFPKFFYRKNGLDRKVSARLFFNEGGREVAIQFLDTPELDSYKLCGRESCGRYISPKSFLEKYGIRVSSTKRYPYEKHVREDGTYYVICLDRPGN